MLKNILKSKIILCSISFLIGAVFGYILRDAQINLKIIDISSIFQGELESFTSYFFDFVPDPSFLSDIAAFEAVIIGLAIPLSRDIISRISERYNSDTISNRFDREWEVTWLPILLMINISLAIVLRFFWPDNPSSIIWMILAWIIIVSFILIAIIFMRFTLKLKKYSNTDIILEELYEESKKYFK